MYVFEIPIEYPTYMFEWYKLYDTVISCCVNALVGDQKWSDLCCSNSEDKCSEGQ